MSENNQMMSVEGQLVGMPLAGPESFSQQQLEYLKRALGVDETVLWSGFKTDIPNTGVSSYTLSELATNFETVRIEYVLQNNIYSPTDLGNKGSGTVFYEINNEKARYITYIHCVMNGNNSTTDFTLYDIDTNIYNMNALTWDVKSVLRGQTTNGVWFHITKIVGIHRISGGNQ